MKPICTYASFLYIGSRSVTRPRNEEILEIYSRANIKALSFAKRVVGNFLFISRNRCKSNDNRFDESSDNLMMSSKDPKKKVYVHCSRDRKDGEYVRPYGDKGILLK